MPCYRVLTSDGLPAIICGRLGKHCAHCGFASEFQCDMPVGPRGKTCDRHLCAKHAREVGPDRHYCPQHVNDWTRQRFARVPTQQGELSL